MGCGRCQAALPDAPVRRRLPRAMASVSSSSRGRGPTIRDVARRAGVSVATVSRVINNSPLVVEPTRARVQAAVDELGYRLNATARNLSIGRAMAVGVVVPFFTAPSVIERLRGVVERLGRGERREYDLMLFDVEAPEQRDGALRDLARRDRVAGLLIISLPISDGEVAALQRDGMPAVLVDSFHPRLPRVVIDNVHGGELAAEHLLAQRPSPDRVRRRPSHQPVRLHVQRGSPHRVPRRARARRRRARPGARALRPARARRGGRAGRGAADAPRPAERDLRRLRPAGASASSRPPSGSGRACRRTSR